MKYSELFQFEPITSVIQLTKTGEASIAKDLVHSFVVSKDMEDLFSERILPHLQFEKYNDNKALMIVGNYGTGKSHMMSVIASIAEDARYVADLQYQNLQDQMGCIGGKFKVLRLEIGGVATSLEQIILRNEIEPFLSKLGVSYQFPASDSISSFKPGFEKMMEAFAEKYPNTGLLLVIDEMLEFLESKEQTVLIRDLGFLRQMAEFCQYSKFRVVFGVQESIFDNPKFKFVSSYIGKIKDRTDIIAIQKSDIKFVVEARLLKKNSSQKAAIRTYLEKFKPYYNSLSESFEDFVALFPVHPAFLESFSRMVAIEKREVLKTISNELIELKDKNLPEDELDLITIDKYWPKLNATVNVFEGMKEVKDCYGVLSSKIPTIRQKPYRDMAQRIINGLCIQRMEDTDVSRPIGLTATEMRDTLCLFEKGIAELGSKDLDSDLLTHIETTLRELMKAVNGQFISRNQEGQYYIDIRKTVDFDQIIESKAQTLGQDQLDQYYFELLKQMLEVKDDLSFMSTSKIWNYELQWLSHKMFRNGWLFFGIPNERPTAVPEKDFYLFFIPPMASPKYQDQNNSDELILKLEKKDETFIESLKLYAATSELASLSSAVQKATYQNKADGYGRILYRWFLENLLDCFSLTYRGTTKLLKSWMVGTSIRSLTGLAPNATLNFKDTLDVVAGYCLQEEFQQQATEYPSFSVVLTSQNFSSALQETFRYLLTKQGSNNLPIAILNGLELMDNSYVTPRNSRYAQWILAKLQEKPVGVVLRRNELLSQIHGEEYLANQAYRLERGFVALLLVSLVASGDIVLTLRTKKYDASNLKDLISEKPDTVADFDQIDRPKDWNPAFLKAFVKLFDLPEGNANLIQQGKDSTITDIQAKLVKMLNALAQEEYEYREGLLFWGEPLVSENIPVQDISQFISDLKVDLEKLKVFNTTGKLKTPNLTVDKLEALLVRLDQEKELVKYAEALNKLSAAKGWFDSAKSTLPEQSDWITKYQKLVEEAKKVVQSYDIHKVENIEPSFLSLKKEYIQLYGKLHAKARLSGNDQVRLNSLLKSDLVSALSKLQQISLLPRSVFEKSREDLLSIKPCPALRDKDLEQNPICPHCSYNPHFEGPYDASTKLDQIEASLALLQENWVKTLVEHLEDPMNQETIQLMGEYDQQQIADFLKERELPKPLNDTFIAVLNGALSGLVKKEISRDELTDSLLGEGKPVSLQELRENFEKFLVELMRGEDPDKIRVILG